MQKNTPLKRKKIIKFSGFEITLRNPDDFTTEWTGNKLIYEQLASAWMRETPPDRPMFPLITGVHGSGKLTMAAHCARTIFKSDFYIQQCSAAISHEDILFTKPFTDHQRRVHATAILSSVISGGVCILYGASRLNEDAWSAILPLLDERNYIESYSLGCRFCPHPDFRLTAIIDDSESDTELPEYLRLKLLPKIAMPPPKPEEVTHTLSK